MNTERIQSEYNIPLGKGRYAQIDLCDLDKIEGWTFNISKFRCRQRVKYAEGYAGYKNGKRVLSRLHQLILGEPPKGFEIAHKDGDGLNCHKSNLEFQTRAQNSYGPRAKGLNSTSKYRGVSWEKQRLKWVAQIHFREKSYFLGYFACEQKAAKVYDTAARKFFGEHAACNFPLGDSK